LASSIHEISLPLSPARAAIFALQCAQLRVILEGLFSMPQFQTLLMSQEEIGLDAHTGSLSPLRQSRTLLLACDTDPRFGLLIHDVKLSQHQLT
jgi:hypothetical protein